MPVKIRLRAILCLGLACLWFVSMPLAAAVVDGLYEARVPVADQSSAQRTAALQQAFDAVLVRVSGTRAAAGALAASLGNPSQYIQQYRYEKAPPDPSASVSPVSTPSLVLWAKFDRTVVNNALHSAHAFQWGVERPRTLVWLTLADTPGGRILTAADNSPLMQALVTAAQQRGVPLLFPQMDGPDKAAVGAPDVTGFNLERVRQASQRYRTDAVLMGSVTPFGAGQFAAHWELLYPDRAESWDTPAGDEVVVAVDGVQTSADRYAARYAIAPDAGDLAGVPLQVDNVMTLDAYAKVSAYLAGLTPVRAVHVQQVAKGSVYFTLDIHGSLDNLESALVLGGSMTAVGEAPAAATRAATEGALPAAPLHYSYASGP
ncbi:MAG: DUF2066 domain-containing protein [Bacillota bacterium]